MQDVVDRVKSQGELLSKAAISKYENGKSVPRATTLRALSSALECSPDYLLSESSTSVKWLRFRKKTSLTKRLEAEAIETARQWLEAKIVVDDHIGDRARVVELPSVEMYRRGHNRRNGDCGLLGRRFFGRPRAD
jgi:transcriptional regulator with XRE-family HTH domain